VKLLAANSLN